MRIKEVVSALEQFAPLPLQDGFDNAGMQIGLTDAEVTGALLCLDVTEAIIDEAIALGFNLIVSHHPLIFKGYKSITGKDYVEKCIMKAIKNDIVIYSAHTNLDNAPQGVNFKIAEKIGLKNISILQPKESILINESVGAGVIGELHEPVAETDFLKHIKKIFTLCLNSLTNISKNIYFPTCINCRTVITIPLSHSMLDISTNLLITPSSFKTNRRNSRSTFNMPICFSHINTFQSAEYRKVLITSLINKGI